ncbi:adenylate/guanylate cyclase domain-containing protein [Desulfonema magnum]|uniref:Adenylate/guanylate cyclase catalytic domain-containing protein n=1 Tax=Desulfonema magnum TaxID=45655 RepID=A0A975BH88_9BACT|nr:adenylate/guanylate cyclase domain-containing protein [Desulfonema magnum]QTA85000.1 Adenylate/guanylate cyclase catalytic domain-containing protein [Desulfonema magnum]
MSEQPLNISEKARPSIFKNQTFGLYIFTSIACLLVITVIAIVGYIWHQYSKALTEISDDQMSQVTEMVKEKVINYLTPASVMAKLSTQLFENGAFEPRFNLSDQISDEGDHKVKLKPLITIAPESDSESGVLSVIDDDLLESYGIHLLKSFPQLAMANIADEKGNFMMPKKLPDGKMGTKIINRAVTPPTVTWKYRNKNGVIEKTEESTDVKYDPTGRPWYKGAKNQRGTYWTDVYIFFSDHAPGIATAYPIMSGDVVTGVFSLDIALNEISTFLNGLKIGKTGIAYIINKKNEIIAYPDASRLVQKGADGKLRPARIDELNKAWVTASFQEHKKTGAGRVEFESEGKRYLGSFTNLGESFGKEWKIGVIVPEDDFLGPLIHMRRVVVLISFVVLLISVFIAKVISSSISKPINALTEEAKKIEKLELDGEITTTSTIKEIQMMNNSMASMKKGLRAFEKYVPSTLVRQLIRTGEEARLGGKKVEITILFSDIQGFTNISEKMLPESLMVQLFEYNNELTNIILRERGTIDKYIGDAIMAFWGAPVDYPEHAIFACSAALNCHRKLDELNKKWISEGKPPFITRFGIHTGLTIVGNMGSDERMNYSVLGDSVNLASRIEGINKVYGTRLIVTQDTYEKVSDYFLFRTLDNVAVKGKEKGVRIYELIGRQGENLPDEILTLREAFDIAFQAYLEQDWDKALKIFTRIQQKFPSDQAAELYIRRCTEFKKNSPGKDWDGIARMKTK